VPSRLPRRFLALIVVLVVAVVGVVVAVAVQGSGSSTGAAAERRLTLDVPAAPGSADTVTLDATMYTPATTPAPAVLLAHGFGGSKDSVSAQARQLAADGFVVLAWSARGFGASTGQIGVNAPDAEVADGRALVDYLATQPEVQLDGPGDPRVGVAGASYGGALALSLAGTDPRIDADVAAITWNDLGQALLPDLAAAAPVDATTPAAGATGSDGVLKRSWAGIFFASGASAAGVCGRFTQQVCAGYLDASQSGRPSAALLALLRANSPTSTNAGVRAPTLLLQGEQDTLFGLDQADANARQIAAAGAPVTVSWFAGGHDAGGTNPDADAQVEAFLRFHLLGQGTDPGTGFRYEVAGSVSSRGQVRTRSVQAAAYPGLDGSATRTRTVQLDGASRPVLRPPGASPSAISTIPGLGSALGALASSGLGGLANLDIPGQVATFSTAPLTERFTVTGSPRVAITITDLTGGGEAVLFAKLYDVAADGTKTLPGGGVSAFRVTGLTAATPTTVEVTLPGIVRPVEAGHTLQLAVSTTDQAYAVPLTPAAFTLGLARDGLVLPVVDGTAATSSTVPLAPLLGIGALVLVVAGLALGLRLRRRGSDEVDPALVDTPLVVRGLAKSYADGFRAVDGVDLEVLHGQVLGLLGPNGAGKTTTLRMLMGLISPTEGEIRVFGHRISAGSPVLSRLGSFVEGSGFLPHLTGTANLELYWAATGRPHEDAHLEEALAIAGLGSAVERKVRSYSQGMRQRLAIAQAMLGLPDLLVLDEPTNGLDPPQIRAMRGVLRDYAATGRTVLVSSHLLSEVEQTCSHVVVMHKGKVVAAGTVADIVSADGRVVLRVSDPDRAVEVLRALDGVGEVSLAEPGDGSPSGAVQADLADVPAAEAVRVLVGAGFAVSAVAPRNRLEDVFLALVDNDTTGSGTRDE
jgi:ABC-2 type transport system ATP-binding protein